MTDAIPQDAPPQLSAEMSCETAFALLARQCCDEIDRQLFVFLGSEEISGPHKARVALRRLTTALDAFAPILRRKEAARLRREAKDIFRALGEVRDADVFLDAQGGAALARETRDLRDDIRRGLRKRKAVGFAPALMRQITDGSIYKTKAPGLAARRAPVGMLARGVLDLAWGRALAHGTDLAGMAEEARHDFRKDMKTLRYLAEFFSPLWAQTGDGQGWPRFRRMLQDLQDDLGLLNDLANARRRGRSEGATKEAAALERAGTAWQRLAASAPFWAG